MSKKINTVLGPIDIEKLGNVLIHEHITYADRGLKSEYGSKFFEDKIVKDAAVNQLKKAKQNGIDTIIEGSTINLGRDISLMREISQESGVNIICSTGYYYQSEIYLEMNDEDMIYQFMKWDIEDGIENTGVKPGMLKMACPVSGINEVMHKVYNCISKASIEYNLPIFCHHYPDTKNGVEIINLLKNNGVNMKKFILGHSGDTNDLNYLESILKEGCYIGMDRFAFCDVSNNFENRCNTIIELIKRGYVNQMLLAHDYAVYFGIRESFDSFRQRANVMPDVSYYFISEKVIPYLLANGVSQEDIDIMLKINPKKLFSE